MNFQWNLNLNSIIFIQENAFENVICQNGGHFVQGEMKQTLLAMKQTLPSTEISFHGVVGLTCDNVCQWNNQIGAWKTKQ